MKNLNFKIKGIILAIVLAMVIMPSYVEATEGEKDAVILEKMSGEKIVYIKELENTEFKYAFSDSKDDDGLIYTTCLTDSNDEKVAIIESEKTYKYMFIAQESGSMNIIELDNIKSITEEEIKEVESLTKKIDVTTDESLSEQLSQESTTITKTRGKIVINEEGKYDYQYQIIEILDTNNTTKKLDEIAVELYDQLAILENATTMYERLTVEIKIRDNYSKLLSSGTWLDVEKMSILQPEESQEGEKYIVLIQKMKNGKSIESDIQFMTCNRADEADVEYKNETMVKNIEKRTKLPVTGENLVLYIVLAVILVAIIIIALKMKSSKEKENGKH